MMQFHEPRKCQSFDRQTLHHHLPVMTGLFLFNQCELLKPIWLTDFSHHVEAAHLKKQAVFTRWIRQDAGDLYDS